MLEFLIDNIGVSFRGDPAMHFSLYGILWSLGIQYKYGKSSDSLPEGMFKEVMDDLWHVDFEKL
jgi:hypothetical protein